MGGSVFKQVTLGPGPFRIEVPLSPVSGDPVSVEIRAKKFVSAAGSDRRKLCYLLQDMRVIPDEVGTS